MALVLFLLAGLFAARNLATWPGRLRYPGEESYEGPALAEMLRLRNGVPIYAPGRADGYDAATYGPVYYLLGSRLIDEDNPSYFPLRALSMMATLGCAAACGLLAWWLTESCGAAFLSALMFLSYCFTTWHGLSALSDSLAVFLFFLGFLVAYRFKGTRAILLAAPLVALAFFYKPQYVAGPIAVVVFLVMEKRYRRAVEFAGVLALCGLGLLAFFQWVVFPGQAFYRHFLLQQGPLLSWHQFLRVGLPVFALMFAVPLLMSLQYLRRYPNKLLSCYLISAALLGLLTISKQGAGIQYFFESVLLISSVVPALLAKEAARHNLCVELLALFGVTLLVGQTFGAPPPEKADFERHEAVQRFLRSSFPQHAPSLGFWVGDLVQAGLDTPFTGLWQLEQLAQRGKMSDRELVAEIRAHRFSVIVLNIDPQKEDDPDWLNVVAEPKPVLLEAFLTKPTREALEEEYVPTASLQAPVPQYARNHDRLYFLVPRSTKAPLSTVQAMLSKSLTASHH